MLIFAQNLTN